MDRVTTYVGAVPSARDVLNLGQKTMVSIAKMGAAILGTNTIVNGFTCTPTAPASLTVLLTPGEIYQIENLEATAWSALPQDITHTILKQGILLDPVSLTLTPPGTGGYSQNFLIEVQYQDSDTSTTVLNYYNSSNPSSPYYGPPVGGTGSGAAQSTIRAGAVAYQVKAGTAATTGTQITPSADAGWTGLFVVTVANGQTTITSGNINQVYNAPFIPATLPAVPYDVQSNAWIFAVAGGTANALTASISPAPPALSNLSVKILAGYLNTAAPTLALNGGGAVPIVDGAGVAIPAGAIKPGMVLDLDFNGSSWQMTGPASSALAEIPTFLSAPLTYYVNASTGSDSNNGLSGVTPFLTIQKAINVTQSLNMNGYNVTINVAAGTYAPISCGPVNGSGFISIIGDTTTPANVLIAAASGEAIFLTAPGYIISGVKMTSSTAGSSGHIGAGIRAGAQVSMSNVEFGACATTHMFTDPGGQILFSGLATGSSTAFYNVTGSAPSHIQCNRGVIGLNQPIINLTGTLTFTQFISASNISTVLGPYNTINIAGSVTGTRFVATGNSVINMNGLGASYLPGNAAGSTSTGGQYL